MKQECGEFVMTSNIKPRKRTGSNSDVYGQAASNHVTGSNLEGVIQRILRIGERRWNTESVVGALDATDNDPDRAVDYLLSGIPRQAEVPPAARVPHGAQVANPPAQPARPSHGQGASAMQQAVTLTPEEYKAVKRLAALGFDRAHAREVYLFLNKDEELAANHLLDEFD